MNPYRLLLITDDAGRSTGQLRAIIQAAVAGGVTAVQLREKRATAAQLQSLIRKVSPICRGAGVPLLVNSALLSRLAPPIDVDGVHFAAAGLTAETGLALDPAWTEDRALPRAFSLRSLVRKRLGIPGEGPLLAGYSAHSVEEARNLISHDADYVTLSPIFETASKPGQIPTGTGPIAAARALLPNAKLVGLGGIDEANAASVIHAGADGVAVIRAIMASTDPCAAARQLRRVVDMALHQRL